MTHLPLHPLQKKALLHQHTPLALWPATAPPPTLPSPIPTQLTCPSISSNRKLSFIRRRRYQKVCISVRGQLTRVSSLGGSLHSTSSFTLLSRKGRRSCAEAAEQNACVGMCGGRGYDWKGGGGSLHSTWSLTLLSRKGRRSCIGVAEQNACNDMCGGHGCDWRGGGGSLHSTSSFTLLSRKGRRSCTGTAERDACCLWCDRGNIACCQAGNQRGGAQCPSHSASSSATSPHTFPTRASNPIPTPSTLT